MTLKLNENEDKQFDMITVGRACIDLNAVEYNIPMEETMTFAKYVGGSPANIAIGASKMGLKVGFIGKISDDQHGRYIRSYMEKCDIDTTGMVVDKEGHKVGLAFTEIKSPEECSILMYREQVADLYLNPKEISEDYIKKTKLLLISGTGLAQSPSREAILKSIQIAQDNNIKIAIELDYRPYTWTSREETSLYYSLVSQKSDIIIGTRDEFDVLENIYGGQNEDTVNKLFKHKAKLIIIKHGVDGSYAYTKEGGVYKANAYKTKVLKTFGAGDSFASGLLTALFRGENYEMALKYGSAAASIVVSKHSSSDAMPSVDDIKELINKNEKHK